MIKYPENEIIKTTPNTGERVERGDSVDVVIKRPEKVKMPNVIGLPKEEALQKLKSLGLKDVTIEKVYNQAPKGYQIKSVTANTEIAIHDSNIKLYESLGIKQVYVEDFEHKSFSKAKKP